MSKVYAIAHRGFSAVAPENTLAAFRKALDLKPDFVECDTRRTKDGHMVVMHDAAVDRTTNSMGAIADMTLDDIRNLDAGSWFSTEYARERVPTLEEYLSLPWNDTRPIIEIKEEGTEDQVVEAIQARGMSKKAVLCSFHYRVGFRLPELDPDIRFSPIISPKQKPMADEAVQLADSAAAVNGWLFAVNYHFISSDLVSATHSANMLMEAWTVDDADDMRRMVEMGVRAIGSNNLALLQRVLAEEGS